MRMYHLTVAYQLAQVKASPTIQIKLAYIALTQQVGMFQIAQEITLLILFQGHVLSYVLWGISPKLLLSIVKQRVQAHNMLILKQEHALQFVPFIILL